MPLHCNPAPAEGTVTYQTDRIRKITNATTGTNQTYVYNNKGFVSSYKDSKTNDVRRFTYDAAGRLLSDGTYTYAYDSFNNITSRQAGTNATTFSYDSSKKTRLNSVTENGSTKYFVYDAIGNVTTYKGVSGSASQNLYWTRGNMLASGNVKGNAFSYKYDLNNLRYSKTVDGVETKYYWDDDVLVGESTGDDYIQYIYDASGIAGMRYNDAFYYFEKNLFGDILRVYGVYGSLAAEFRYDSYGNVTSATGSMANRVKFRYRGYYFDDETGFYYLQSRYYDPTICRFVSADQYELLGTLSQTLGQLNLYAYCNNNPIMYADETGEGLFATLLIGALLGGLISGGFTIANQVLTYGWNAKNWDWVQIGRSVLGGAVAGAISAIPTASWILAFVYGGAGSLLGGFISGTIHNFGDGIAAVVIGGAANAIAYGINEAILNAKTNAIYTI